MINTIYTDELSPGQSFLAALDRKPLIGPVPHFELVFYLTMEAFGKVHPIHCHFEQWDQMTPVEKKLHKRYAADVYIQTCKTYGHGCIFLHMNSHNVDSVIEMAELIKERSNGKYCVMIHGDPTLGIPDGGGMEEFSYRLMDEPKKLKQELLGRVEYAVKTAEQYIRYQKLIDGFIMVADYCLNTGPFLSPSMFSEFVTPYLAKTIKAYRDMGFYTIKHTDGNIMPILDQLVQADPHGLHSLDPQAGVDIVEVKRLVGDKVCLIGNVNCGLMQSGSDEEVAESARYALKHGMPGGGYIFSTSNCIFSGMPLKRYEMIVDIWRREGVYKT